MARTYSSLKIKFDKIRRIDFELSEFCNLDCIMCERDKSDKKSLYGINFVSELLPLIPNLQYAFFFGGEPFMIPIYYDLWDSIIRLNPACKIIVQTNGNVMNARIERLLLHPGFLVAMSLDSLNDEKYDQIRKNGSLRTFMENFELFNNAMKKKSQTMQISACPMRINWKEIPALVEFCNKNACRIFFNHVEFPDYLNLKNIPSGFLKIIIQYLKSQHRMEGKTDIEAENSRAFSGLLQLLEYWLSQSLVWESQAVKITKHEVYEIMRNSFESSNEHFINEILKDAPGEWLIDERSQSKIKNIDFKNELQSLLNHNITIENIVLKARSLFKLNRLSNIIYE
ncbi:MAG TPA: radical SAM protein [Bacteroidales bacterium]|nr:radical SAM protein [Bacteroidales bacterium]